MMTDVCKLRDRAERLCQRVLSADWQGPLYILLQSECAGSGSATHCAFAGFTDDALDLVYRDSIGDRWRGRGAAMLICDRRLLADCSDPRVFAHVFLATAAHELAHIGEYWRGPQPMPASTLARKAEVFDRAMSEDYTRTLAVEPWLQHDHRFIRAACHVAYRFRRLGVPLTASALCAGWQYGLSHASTYEKALGRESKRMRRLPIRTILSLPEPPEFTALFAADVRAWEAREGPTQ